MYVRTGCAPSETILPLRLIQSNRREMRSPASAPLGVLKARARLLPPAPPVHTYTKTPADIKAVVLKDDPTSILFRATPPLSHERPCHPGRVPGWLLSEGRSMRLFFASIVCDCRSARSSPGRFRGATPGD